MTKATRVETLASLDEGLRVRHIASFDIERCEFGEDPAQVLARPEWQPFDQIPMAKDGRIVAVVERCHGGRVRTLDDSLLVSADDHLSHFIHTIDEDHQYRLVVEKTAITGIVTWSDLLKLPIMVLAFSLTAKLELEMNQCLRDTYGNGDRWLGALIQKDAESVQGKFKQLQGKNLAVSTIESAYLQFKAKALRDVIGRESTFQDELDSIVKLRDNLAHAKDVVRSSADLKRFVREVELVEEWLEIFESRNGRQVATAHSL